MNQPFWKNTPYKPARYNDRRILRNSISMWQQWLTFPAGAQLPGIHETVVCVTINMTDAPRLQPQAMFNMNHRWLVMVHCHWHNVKLFSIIQTHKTYLGWISKNTTLLITTIKKKRLYKLPPNGHSCDTRKLWSSLFYCIKTYIRDIQWSSEKDKAC